jgi:MFS family permease
MKAEVKPYTAKERWSVGVSAILGFGFDFYDLLIISFLLGAIMKTLGMTLTEAGLIATSTLLGSVIGGILFGWVGDKLGRKNALYLTLALITVGSLLSAFSWNFWSLLIFRFILGIGVGGEWGAGMVLFNEVWDKKKRGFGSSMVQAASCGAIAAGAVVSVWALSSFSPDWGWRVALLTGATPILLMLYVRFFMPESRLWEEYERLRKAGQLPAEKAKMGNPLIEIFKGASLRYTLIGLVVAVGYMFSFYSVAVFMPSLFRQAGGLPDTIRTASLGWAVLVAPFMLLLGWYSDRIGRRIALIAATVIALVGFVGIYYASKTPFAGSAYTWPLVWWYIIWGFGAGAVAIVGPWLSELYPVELRASAVSAIYTLGRGGGSLAPYVVPVVAGQVGGDLAVGMMVGAIGAVASIIAALFLPETAGRSFAVVEARERTA